MNTYINNRAINLKTAEIIKNNKIPIKQLTKLLPSELSSAMTKPQKLNLHIKRGSTSKKL